MTRHDTLDPAIERELEALDEALRGDGSDSALLAFVSDVQATRAQPTAAFEADLDRRVKAGFPRSAPWLFKLPTIRPLVPVLGMAACFALIALVAGLALRDSGTATDNYSAGGSAAETSLSEPEIQSSAAMPSEDRAAQPDAAAKALDAPLTQPRKVQRAADLTLTTSADDVQNVADGVVRETQKAGGYVADSSVSTSTESGEARFTLRIPAGRLDATLAALSKLASVGSLSQNSEDITAQSVSAADRLSDALAERKALLRALAEATAPGRIAALKQRIAINRREVAAAKADVRQINRRADLSTVNVEVEGNGKHIETGGAWSVGDAFHDAGRMLGFVAGALVIALAVAVPLGVLLGAGWAAFKLVVRRRRDAMLDAA
ncbi:MAG TPA: DUF4349 domain-containing protein [Baekduia sp.]|nr:DUF4349 domain-containing protein [Baekduia sp.]